MDAVSPLESPAHHGLASTNFVLEKNLTVPSSKAEVHEKTENPYADSSAPRPD
jgi:hypothetical protein